MPAKTMNFEQGRGMLRSIKLLILVLVVLFGLLFYYRNDQIVTVDYYLGVVEQPLLLFMAVAALTGLLVGWLASMLMLAPVKAELRRLRKQKALAEQEANKLRALSSDAA